MKITKLGHCCLVIEEAGMKILTDPGSWTTAQNEITGLDLVLITHEHPDHLHVDSVKQVLANNPKAIVVTNSAVGKILNESGIQHELLEDGQNKKYKEVLIEAFGTEHGKVYGNVPDTLNTGYFIANKFFYPGDALHNPGKPVEVLALPVAGPWLKTSEAIDYAKEVNPKTAFPVHDGLLNERGKALHKHPQNFLAEAGIKFVILEDGQSLEA